MSEKEIKQACLVEFEIPELPLKIDEAALLEFSKSLNNMIPSPAKFNTLSVYLKNENGFLKIGIPMDEIYAKPLGIVFASELENYILESYDIVIKVEAYLKSIVS